MTYTPAVCADCGASATRRGVTGPYTLIHAAWCGDGTAPRPSTWTSASIADFEASIHPPALCPVGGCAACYEAPRPSSRTAHRAICVDDEGKLDCVCGLGVTR